MAEKLRYLGVPVYMDGRNYFVPSLSYQDFRKNYEFLSQKITALDLEGEKMLEYFEKVIPLVGLALRRNYPEIADEQIAGMVDMTTMPLLYQAIQNASGMKAVSEGE